MREKIMRFSPVCCLLILSVWLFSTGLVRATDNSLIIFNINKSTIPEWRKILANSGAVAFLDSSKVDIIPVIQSQIDANASHKNVSAADQVIQLVFYYLLINDDKKDALQFLDRALEISTKNAGEEPREYFRNLKKDLNAWLSEHNFPDCDEIIKKNGQLIKTDMTAAQEVFKTLFGQLSEEEKKAVDNLGGKNSENMLLSVCFINDKLEYDCLRKKFLEK